MYIQPRCSLRTADHISNGITLASHLHLCLDKTNSLVFVPLGGSYVAYFLCPMDEPSMAELYHNTLVSMPGRVRVELLYARFAYNIIRLSQETTSSFPDLARVPIPADLPSSLNPPRISRQTSHQDPPGENEHSWDEFEYDEPFSNGGAWKSWSLAFGSPLNVP